MSERGYSFIPNPTFLHCIVFPFAKTSKLKTLRAFQIGSKAASVRTLISFEIFDDLASALFSLLLPLFSETAQLSQFFSRSPDFFVFKLIGLKSSSQFASIQVLGNPFENKE